MGELILEQLYTFKRQLNELSKIQFLLLLLIVFIFLPTALTFLYLLFLLLYSIHSKDLQKALKQTKKGKFLIIFSIFSLLTSIFHSNLIGAAISIIMFVCFLIIFIYRHTVNKTLFYLTIKTMTIMSLLCAAIGIIQFHFINLSLNSSNILLIADRPEFRVSSTFGNANYYATILEFVILVAFYKLFLVKNKESSFTYYFTIIVINCFMLYLTGCRTAWVALFITIPIMFLFQKKYWIGISLIVISLLGFYFLVSFELIPRLDTILKDFQVRLNIWRTSFLGFLSHPLFGMGPFAYKLIYKPLNGPLAPHSHSLYLEVLLSYGIVGVSTVLCGTVLYLKELFSNHHKESYSFAIGTILVVIIHGLLDVTIINLQTGILFLIIISSTSVQDFDIL